MTMVAIAGLVTFVLAWILGAPLIAMLRDLLCAASCAMQMAQPRSNMA